MRGEFWEMIDEKIDHEIAIRRLWPYLTSFELSVLLLYSLGIKQTEIGVDYDTSKQNIQNAIERVRRKANIFMKGR